jgi:hypothetical protein
VYWNGVSFRNSIKLEFVVFNFYLNLPPFQHVLWYNKIRMRGFKVIFTRSPAISFLHIVSCL